MQSFGLRDQLGGGMRAAQQAQLDDLGSTPLAPEPLTVLFAACPADWERIDRDRGLVSATVSMPLSPQITD